ncbi:MAG: ribose 5-phosphate isomerase B [Oligoflexales bacterium]|nr:ribose 5-phosphate isomerase B [Oligoflexales bacterium]
MRIYIGSDHGGYKLKNALELHLKESGKFTIIDLGVFEDIPTDYPDIAREVSEKVVENNSSKGILICGSGIGVSMAANKIKGIRAALCTNEYMAEMSRKHNDANVLCMGERVISQEEAFAITDKFFSTDFEVDEERHVRRVAKIEPKE